MTYTEEDMLIFARIASGGAYGDYRGCNNLTKKLERFKSLNKIKGTIMEKEEEKEKVIALIKKHDIIRDEDWYHLTIDGSHVDGSFSKDKDKVQEMFNNLIANNGEPEVVEILEERTFYKNKVVDGFVTTTT